MGGLGRDRGEIDHDLTTVVQPLWEQPDSSTIDMLQHADCTLSRAGRAILPTLKVILLGGMQEPAMPPA